MNKELLIDIIGWLAGVAVVIAYAMVSMKKADLYPKLYQWLNLLGSLGLIVNTYYYGAYPSVAINAIWCIIAVVVLAKAVKK